MADEVDPVIPVCFADGLSGLIPVTRSPRLSFPGLSLPSRPETSELESPIRPVMPLFLSVRLPLVWEEVVLSDAEPPVTPVP